MHARPALLALAALLLLAACGGAKVKPDDAPAAGPGLAGNWRDVSSYVDFVIVGEGAKARLVSAVHDDGEAFEIQRSGWEDGRFGWTYLVPSTGYVVTFVVKDVTSDSLVTDWSNQHGFSGEEVLERQ